MSNKAGRQPHFENPPVSEVAVSVSFVPLQNWQAPHAGLYWGTVANDYPKTKVHPPVAVTKEKFGDEFWIPPRQNIQVEVVGIEDAPPPMRTWFISDDDSRLIQVQRDRFIVNWRKREGAPRYPRYHEAIRPRFEQEWSKFRTFINKEGLGEVIVEQCEITYVNDIEQGQGWATFADFGKIFAPWAGKTSNGFLPPLHTLKCAGSFEMPDRVGRLNFNTQHLRRNTDKKEVLQISLMARGQPKSSENAQILEWIDIGHDWIVNGFVELTTPEAHQIWERKA